jgi:hypothetical protein
MKKNLEAETNIKVIKLITQNQTQFPEIINVLL